MELVREDSISQQQQQQSQPLNQGGDDANDTFDENYDPSSSMMTTEELLSTPFDIVHQFHADDNNQPITSLLFHDETLYTAAGSSGEIKVWSFDDSLSSANNKNNNGIPLIPVLNLQHAHGDKIVVMKTLSNIIVGTNEKKKIGVNDHNLLLMASFDG